MSMFRVLVALTGVSVKSYRMSTIKTTSTIHGKQTHVYTGWWRFRDVTGVHLSVGTTRVELANLHK